MDYTCLEKQIHGRLAGVIVENILLSYSGLVVAMNENLPPGYLFLILSTQIYPLSSFCQGPGFLVAGHDWVQKADGIFTDLQLPQKLVVMSLTRVAPRVQVFSIEKGFSS